MSNSWNEAIDSLTINDDNWMCTTTMIVETIPSHARFVESFDEAAIDGSRKAIYPLTLRKVMSSVRSLSKVDQDKSPMAQGVFHHANKLIASGEKLDSWLTARLVKYLVYLAKMEMIVRAGREADRENEIDRDIRAMLTVTNLGSRPSLKSAKSKKSVQNLETAATLKSTRLRKLGEERRDKVYVDDAPENGPDLYFILTGFRDPDLPLALIKAGLPLTCILKIKRPEEYSVKNGAENNFPGGCTEKELDVFWSNLEKSADDPNNLDAFSGTIFRTLCPPDIPSHPDPKEVEKSKKDVYDRLSFIVYDLYDLQRLHVDYIRSMKLVNVPEEPRRGSMAIYTKIMDEVPAECSFVSVILQAMLAQVETDSKVEEGSNSELCSDRSNGEELSRNGVKRMLSHHEVSEYSDVVLEYDQLRLKTYHVTLADDVMNLIDPKPESLAELASRSLRDRRIIDLWSNRDVIAEATAEQHRYRLRKMADCFGDPIDPERLSHYLHLRVFDKMIHGRLNGTWTGAEDPFDAIRRKDAIPVVTRSDPFPLSSKNVRDDLTLASGGNPISNLRPARSDGIIDYRESGSDIVQCPEMLYARKESRKVPGELQVPERNEKLGETATDSSHLEEFIDVRRLSSRVLSQAIRECFRTFRTFHHEYVEMTDSMLLRFDDGTNECTSNVAGQEEERTDEQVLRHGGPRRHRQVSRIVTPVCLRNFCEYVVAEETNFIREMEISRASKKSTSIGELTRKLSRHSDIDNLTTMTFTDDDFILPDSLKGQARRKKEEAESLIVTDPKITKIDTQTAKNYEDRKTKKDKRVSLKTSSNEKNLKIENIVDVDDSASTFRKFSSLRCALDDEPHKFVGYDLGKFRVQLTNESETFLSSDGTLVKVDLHEWLYGKKRIDIGIELAGCFLKLQSTINDEKNDRMPFHLITEKGIVMAFLKIPKIEELSRPGEQSSPLPFEFCASWPSSLSVELVKDEGYENPFHLLQRYISKGPECKTVSRESYRKFLRNGTVLKFLDDNEIEVLRPNGTIVRCHEYKSARTIGQTDLGQSGNLARGESTKSAATRQRTSTRGKRKSSSPTKRSGRNFEDKENRKDSTDISSLERSIGEVRTPREDDGRGKIIRYTAVEHDGTRYEVVNDEVSRTYDRSLVRTSTDFEASEKFTRRDDGTRSILNSRGELIVCFPDGTRIITGYVIEDEALLCDWSFDEITKFFGNDVDRDSRTNGQVISPRLSNATWSGSYRSVTRGYDGRDDDRHGILLSDAFVSVLMTCRMEHECYATVAYDGSENSWTLSMPDDVRVGITRQGFFDISIGRKTELFVRDEELTFSSKMCESGRSTSIYKLIEPRSIDFNEILLVTTDSTGEIFQVKEDGRVVRHQRAVQKSSSSINEKHQRLFAMKRDFTGHEYLHKSQREQYQSKINSNDGGGLISMIIPGQGRGPLEYRLFLRPLEPTNYSKTWLQKVTKIVRTNEDRSDFLRSTYSSPYEWLFPYGRHGNGVRKETCKLRIGETVVGNHPRVLTLMIFERIAKPGDRFLNELEKAIECCDRKTVVNLDIYRSIKDDISFGVEVQGGEWLNDLALGIKTYIETRDYICGLLTKRIDRKSRKIRKVTECRKRGQRKSLENEEIRWYERCIREGIILPYFKNIRGSCFLWITSCVDKALECSWNNSGENFKEL